MGSETGSLPGKPVDLAGLSTMHIWNVCMRIYKRTDDFFDQINSFFVIGIFYIIKKINWRS